MGPSKHVFLEHESSEPEDEKGLLNQLPVTRYSTSSSRLAFGALATALFLSLCFNIVLLFTQLHTQAQSNSESRSPFGKSLYLIWYVR